MLPRIANGKVRLTETPCYNFPGPTPKTSNKGGLTMSDELEIEADIFVDEGVFYCTCGNPIEAEDVSGKIEKQGGKEFVSCPSCDMKHFADGGHFRLGDD